MATRDQESRLRCQQDSRCEDGEDMASIPSKAARIGTKGCFFFMELPVELRLKVYNYLLVCSETITIPQPADASYPEIYPSTAILQTCQTINEEGTPILYSHNTFTITLPLERRERSSLTDIPPSFQLSNFRWSTLASMASLSFKSNNSIMVPDITISPACRPVFTCSGRDIISRFSSSDIRYSPEGPDEYMALSISNWVSTKVMRAELTAFQAELEDMMRGGMELMEGAGNGPGTGDDGGDWDGGFGAGAAGET